MIIGFLCFAALMVLLPLAVNEFGELAPWLARRLLRWGARRLASSDARERYAEEWLANLEHVPGRLTKLLWVCGLLLWSVPQIRWRYRQRRAPIASARRMLRLTAARRLGLAVLASLAVVVGCGVALSVVQNVSFWDGTYLALLTALGGVDPDPAAAEVVKLLHVVITMAGLVLIPLVTATVVEAVVRVRLAGVGGRDLGPK